jgi:hypothetical protein
MKSEMRVSRRLMFKVYESWAPEYRRSRETLGNKSVLVFAAYDPVTRERATMAAGVAAWRHLGLGCLEDLSEEDRTRVILHLLPIIELQNADSDDAGERLVALRHGLHQARLPGEKRGHQHLCIAMHLLEGSRRERSCKPLWSGTIRVAERRIVLRIHPYGRGLMLEAFDPLRHRVHKLMVPATEWNWMGHGHLAWLGPNEKEALCWKLIRRLNVEDGNLKIDLLPNGSWWLGLGTPNGHSEKPFAFRGGVRYAGKVYLASVVTTLTNGVVERYEERAKDEHSLYCLHPGDDGADTLDKHASLQSHRDAAVDRATTIRWKIKPLEVQAGEGRQDILFQVKLFEYGGRKTVANPDGARVSKAHEVEVEYGAKRSIGIPDKGSFAEALDSLWAPLAPSVRRVHDFGPYEWMGVEEKWKCAHKGAMLAALKHEKIEALAQLRLRAKRAIAHCAHQDEAFVWLKWRAQGARFHGAKQGRALGWLRIFGQKCLRNDYVRNEAQFFLKRLRAHVCGRRRQAARFLQQCGQHALMWQHDPGARSVFWFGWRDEQPALIWHADDEHVDEHQARIRIARKRITRCTYDIERVKNEKHELLEHEKRHPTEDGLARGAEMVDALERCRLQIEESERQIVVHEPLLHLDPRKEEQEPAAEEAAGEEQLNPTMGAAPPRPPSAADRISGKQLGFERKGGARGGIGVLGAWQARGTGTEELGALGRCQREYFGGDDATSRRRVEAWLEGQDRAKTLTAAPVEAVEEASSREVREPKPTGLYECKFESLPLPVEERGVGAVRQENAAAEPRDEEPSNEDYTAIVTEIYMKHNPEKLKDPDFITDTLEKYVGKEEQLIAALKKKYTEENAEETQVIAKLEAAHDYPAIVREIYQKHNPEKLVDPDFVANTLKRYAGKENVLIAALEKKYGIIEDKMSSDDDDGKWSDSDDEGDYAAQVTAIYRKHNPEKLADPDFVANTLKRYEGKEEQLLAALRKKYTEEKEHIAELEAAHDYKAIVTDIYQQHNPAKLGDTDFVANTLARYAGKEEQLVVALKKKYGIADEPTKTAAPAKAAESAKAVEPAKVEEAPKEDTYVAQLTAIYTKHNPEKLQQDAAFIKNTLEKYAGKEKQLIVALKKKYAITDEPAPVVQKYNGPLRTHSFDTNGILYFLGTNGGTEDYTNPQTSGKVKVAIHTLEKGSGAKDALVAHSHDGKVVNLTHDKPSQWMSVDLGDGRSLVPNHYCLRHGNDNGEKRLRFWRFQGSKDGKKWVTLREHKKDHVLADEPFSVGGWPVKNVEGESYRKFRIFQTGKNSEGTHVLSCAGIELYGQLVFMNEAAAYAVDQAGWMAKQAAADAMKAVSVLDHVTDDAHGALLKRGEAQGKGGDVVAAVLRTEDLREAKHFLHRRAASAIDTHNRQDQARAFTTAVGMKQRAHIRRQRRAFDWLHEKGRNAVVACVAVGVVTYCTDYAVAERVGFVMHHRSVQINSLKWLRHRALRALAHAWNQDMAVEDLEAYGQEGKDFADRLERCAAFVQRHFRGHAARGRVLNMLGHRWTKCWDEDKKIFYYYNSVSEEAVWERPFMLRGKKLFTEEEVKTREHKQRLGRPWAKHRAPQTEEAAARIMQARYRMRKARKLLHKQVDKVYERVYDHEKKVYYYFNKQTGEARWDKPQFLDSEELKETPLWEKRWFVIEQGVLTQYLEKFDDGETKTEVCAMVKLKRVKKIMVRKDNELCLITKHREHRLKAMNKTDCLDWAEAIAKYVDLSVIHSTQTLLFVTIHRASKLKQADLFGLSDPYVKVKVNPWSVGRGQAFKTKTIMNTLSPVWEESFKFYLTGKARKEGHVQLDLFDYDFIGSDDRLGHVSLRLDKLPVGRLNQFDEPDSPVREWFEVRGGLGEVDVTLALVEEGDEDDDPEAAQRRAEAAADNAIVEAAAGKRSVLQGMLAWRPFFMKRKGKKAAEEEGEKEEEEGKEDEDEKEDGNDEYYSGDEEGEEGEKRKEGEGGDGDADGSDDGGDDDDADDDDDNDDGDDDDDDSDSDDEKKK